MAIKFEENETVTLRFPFADFRETEGQFGHQYQYHVDTGSRLDRLYASPALHLRLQECGLTPGCIAAITATRGPNRRRQWVVTRGAKVEPAPAPPSAETLADLDAPPIQLPTPVASSGQPQPTPAARVTTQAPPANGNGQPVPASPPPAPAPDDRKPGTNGKSNGHAAPPAASLDDLAQLMSRCLTAASQAWEQIEDVQCAPADIRSVGITLFLECSRRCVAPEPVVLGPAFVEKVLGHTDDLPF